MPWPLPPCRLSPRNRLEAGSLGFWLKKERSGAATNLGAGGGRTWARSGACVCVCVCVFLARARCLPRPALVDLCACAGSTRLTRPTLCRCRRVRVAGLGKRGQPWRLLAPPPSSVSERTRADTRPAQLTRTPRPTDTHAPHDPCTRSGTAAGSPPPVAAGAPEQGLTAVNFHHWLI
jgi:hypothetical protein